MYLFRLFILPALLFFLCIPALAQKAHPGDSLLLVDLYNATGGENWNDNTNWLSEKHLDSWYGVSVDSNGRVDTLILRDNNLAGELPENLHELQSLKVLKLSNNNLYGTVPELHRIPALGDKTFQLEEFVFLNNRYTIRDIAGNEKAFDEFLNGKVSKIYIYGGLSRQVPFGTGGNIRGTPGEELVIDAGEYRGTESTVYIWNFENDTVGEFSGIVDTTSTPVLILDSFDPSIHSGSWHCTAYPSSSYEGTQSRHRFYGVHVRGPENITPLLEWDKREHSVKDRWLSDEQIRITGEEFSPVTLASEDDFPRGNLSYRILHYPENLQVIFGCSHLVRLEESMDNFNYTDTNDSTFAGCGTYTMLSRRNNKNWTGRDSVVVQVCDEEGACTKSSYYFTSLPGFAPEKPDLGVGQEGSFLYELYQDTTLKVSWDPQPGVDTLAFRLEAMTFPDCQAIRDTFFVDSASVSADAGTLTFDKSPSSSEEEVLVLNLTAYAINEYGASLPAYYTIDLILPPERSYGFTHTMVDDNTIRLYRDIREHGACQRTFSLFQSIDNGPFEIVPVYMGGKGEEELELEPGRNYAFYISPSPFFNKVTRHFTSDTIHVYVPDKAPEIMGSLEWEMQKRLTKLKESLVRDDKDTSLHWTFSSEHLLVSETEKDLNLYLKDTSWSGTDTLRFSAEDSGNNILDTFALVEVERANTPPRFSVPSDVVANFPVEEGTVEHIDLLSELIEDNETAPEDINFSVINNGTAVTSLEGDMLYITAPVGRKSGTSDFMLIAEDEGLATDTMYVQVQYRPRENQPPDLDIPTSVYQEYGEIRYLSDVSYPPLPLGDYVSDDITVDSISWRIEPIDFDKERVKAMLDMHIINDSLYISPSPEADFRMMNMDINPAVQGNSFVFYIFAEDIDGGKDSSRMQLTMGNDYPEIKDFPYSDLYAGDTVEFNPFDYIVFPSSVDTALVTMTTQMSDAIISEDVDPVTNTYKVWPGPFIFSNAHETHIPFFIHYLDQSFTIRFPVVVHPRINQAPVLSEIPRQETSSAEGSFSVIDLSGYVDDDHTPATHLFWYIEGADHINAYVRNGKLEVTIDENGWSGSDTVTVIAEDLDYLSDSIEVVFTSVSENSAPVISNIPGQSVVTGEEFAPVFLDSYISDDHTAPENISWSIPGNENFQTSVSAGVVSVSLISEEWEGTDSLRFIATDEEGLSDSVWVSFTVSLVNGTLGNDDCAVNLSPNPAQGMVKLDVCDLYSESNCTIYVINQKGQVVLKQALRSGNEVFIQTESLPQGIYYVSIESPGSQKRLIKKMVVLN